MSLTSDGRETKAQRFLSSRREFFELGQCPEEGVGSIIMRSWQRCRDLGLEHSAKAELDVAGRSGLAECRERNALILEQASGVMEHVFEQIRSSGSLVILADPEGCIIHSLGDPDFVDRANRVALQPGACWNESLRGTNAIGTAIVEKRPVEVLGLEHYMEGNGFLSCSAVPVMAADGKLCAVLDISSDHRAHQRHTLGLVKLSVQLLEKRLFESAYSGGILIAFHERPEYLGSLQEGVIALSPDGELLGANTVARDWLTARVSAGDAVSFNSIFAQGFRRIIDKASSTPSALLKLAMRHGGDLYVQVRSMRPLVVPISRDEANADRAGEPRTSESSSPVDAEVGQISHTRNVGHAAHAGPAINTPHPVHASRPPEGASARISLDSLATGDPALGRALDRARRVQGKDIPLLIQGESGVGKELFAQAFHNSGPRAAGPFVALNCAAVPETLIESELFGYVGGAFTGARREGAMGRIQQAHGGTLFLDEIGDMPLGMQARLLRVLQERRVTPVGSLKSIPVDIALVCATHRVLSEAVANGSFREDLYYRVNSLTVCLPPLRKRTDIRVIVQKILTTEAVEAVGRKVAIGDEVMQFFERHNWPGNIRQLQNVIRVAVALLDPDEDEILPIHLPEELFASDPADDRKMGGSVPPESLAQPPATDLSGAISRGGRLDQVELDAINAVMREVGGNVSAAARILGVSRNRLYRKLGRLN